MLSIQQAETSVQIDEARKLFREYEAWLGLDLCFQGFEEELRDLPGKYAPPDGRLYLAYFDSRTAGCIAMRNLNKGICEMKRLFVRDEFRGKKIGAALISRIIDDASAAGYSKMRLDTFPPKMPKAVELYGSFGFHKISPYYDNPHAGTIFMEMDL